MAEKYYLTRKGFERVKKEYRGLLEVKRRKGREGTPRILLSGDLNPDYFGYQEEMSLLEVRLAEHERVLKNTELITTPKGERKKVVSLGATVTLEEEPGKQINEYTILGSLEANPAEGNISNESPVGRELIGKAVGDVVIIRSPIQVTYRIKKIAYTLT